MYKRQVKFLIGARDQTGDPIYYFNNNKTKESISVTTIMDEELKQRILQEAIDGKRLLISGNKASKGGGIGSNANIGEPKDLEEYVIKAVKKWKMNPLKDTELPEKINLDLYYDGYRVGTVEVVPDADGKWEAEFKGLPIDCLLYTSRCV